MTRGEAQREAVRMLRRVAVELRVEAAWREAMGTLVEERAGALGRDDQAQERTR